MRNLGLSALILGVAGLALWPALPPRPLLAGAAVLGIGLTALGNRWRPFGLFLLGSALAGASASLG
ncbi:MAG: hypothetical protein RML12_07030 [Xanthomonadales bacterium]|nr:hypothetical protein [Xanthomonadales bacterium]